MRVITGDETGLIKQVLIENKRIQRWGTQSRKNEIHQMKWAGEKGSEENEIASSLANGTVEIWDVDKTEVVNTFRGEAGRGVGMGILRNQEVRRCVVCNEDGLVSIFRWEEEGCISNFDVKGPISSMRLSGFDNNVIAVGGKENDLALFDLEKQEAIWRGRNVPNDFLNLRVPVWVSDMQFMENNCVAVVTGYHHVRIYDPRAQRRPTQSIEIGKSPFTRCCFSKDESILFTGDTVGRVSAVDMKTMRLNGVYKGNTGAIHDMAVHPTLNMLTTVGLDRIMRVYDTTTRQQLHRVYLRQRLNCVLFSEEEEVKMFAKEEEEDSSEEEDLMEVDEEGFEKEAGDDTDDETMLKEFDAGIDSEDNVDDETLLKAEEDE